MQEICRILNKKTEKYGESDSKTWNIKREKYSTKEEQNICRRRQNIGQEDDQILGKRRAKFWTTGRQTLWAAGWAFHEGEGGKIFDRRTPEC
jgi:hypothetical protein